MKRSFISLNTRTRESQPRRRHKKKFPPKQWEVCLYADYPEYREVTKYFRTLWGASRVMRKALNKNREFYCATIWREKTSLFYTFYWNGKQIMYWKFWKRPWVFSRRQAKFLRVDRQGRTIIRPFMEQEG